MSFARALFIIPSILFQVLQPHPPRPHLLPPGHRLPPGLHRATAASSGRHARHVDGQEGGAVRQRRQGRQQQILNISTTFRHASRRQTKALPNFDNVGG